MTDVVLFEELSTACGRRFGVATLNAPSTLNALSLAMAQSLGAKLQQWARDDAVVGVLLQGTGDKAFCAGGDLRAVHAAWQSDPARPSDYARLFFAQEYRLDYLIHTYNKPILCWGHGIVMGGGIGLMSGASHRVVTPHSRLAMPEISIGLYPDVGGSWLLRRMPRRIGLFLGLTGALLNSTDALFCGLADVCVATEALPGLRKMLQATRWASGSAGNRAELSRLLTHHGVDTPPESNVRKHFDCINEMMAGDSLTDIAARLRDLKSDDPWLLRAATTFAKGCPTSAALTFALWNRVTHLSLADVFRLEYNVSLGCCAHRNFAEGIRALLIDKDRQPQWDPPSLAAVTPELVEAHFKPSFEGPHPLAGLVSQPAGAR